MRLSFFRGPNFGDALNPRIFNRFLPDFFDEDDSVDFFGIGSIIGFDMVRLAKRKIIFSSGFAYGDLPELDNTYDVICVRGPHTAAALNLPKKMAITDGAALLREFDFSSTRKKHKFSFMPHWRSEETYAWKALCEEADIHYISPRDNTGKVIDEIMETEIMLAEAMHAAIVADSLRVPWIPVKAYAAVNDFKWSDWTASLDMQYLPNHLHSLSMDDGHIQSAIARKFGWMPALVRNSLVYGYEKYQNIFHHDAAVKQLQELKNRKIYLSDDHLFNSRVDQLLEKLDEVKNKYVPRITELRKQN
jgi:succinoglycan biosynthesis protein ExoV